MEGSWISGGQVNINCVGTVKGGHVNIQTAQSNPVLDMLYGTMTTIQLHYYFVSGYLQYPLYLSGNRDNFVGPPTL